MAANASAVTKSPKIAANYNLFDSHPIGSRSHSPHFSFDRITRHASPSRQDLAQNEVCIVPRIPQPYRTSFSAVTSPMRVPKAAISELTTPPKPSPINLLGVHRRTTSPGRITPMKPNTYQHPMESTFKQCVSNNTPCFPSVNDAETAIHLQGSDYPDIVQDCSNSPPKSDITTIQTCASLPQDQPTPCLISEKHSFTNTVCWLKAPSSDIKATADLSIIVDRKGYTELGNIKTCDDIKFNGEEGGHVKQAGHHKLFGKFKSFKSAGGSSVNKTPDVPNSRYKKVTNDKKKESEDLHFSESTDGRERSRTLPPQAILVDDRANLNKNQKSLSMSITSFFRKMSPKSLRRFAFNSERAARRNHSVGTSADSLVEFGDFECGSAQQSASGSSVPFDVGADSCGISVESDVPLLNAGMSPRRSRSLKKSPRMSSMKRLFGRGTLKDSDSTSGERHVRDKHVTENHGEKSKVDSADKCIDIGNGAGLSGHPMTPEMNLILKSIEYRSAKAQKKSVYQTFKEKRSPVRASEGALGLKPQVLQAVEFPENLLQPESLGPGISNPSSGLSSSLPGLLDDVDEGLPVITCQSISPDGKVLCAERPNLETLGRKREPPRTLNVRAVQNVGGRHFQFPSASVESIGQCSLDVANAGSEASLVQNGHFSSTSASKRTLNSQENITEPATKSALQCDNSCDSLVQADDVVCGANDFDNVESRSPSYLKLSRAIGGYTPYNTYTSIVDHERIRTEKSDSRNKASSSNKQQKDTEVVIQNGDAVVTVKQSLHTGGYGSTGQCSLLGAVGCIAGGPAASNGVASGCNNRLSSTVCANVLVADVPDQKMAPSSCVFTDSDVCRDVPSVKLLPQASGDCCSTNDADALRVRSSFHEVFVNSAEADLPQRDGWFFLNLVDSVELLLKQQCVKIEQDLLTNTSEEVEGKMRATVGKANLLIRKKFPQFRQLCHACLEQSEDEPFRTTVQDLSGFWDMVLIQVEDVNKQFEEIEVLRQAGWKETKAAENHDVATPTKTAGTKIKTPKSQTTMNSKSPSLSSSKSPSSAAAKAREEARRRLMAAKMAGRQRKASESDKDIEIFVS